MHVLRINANLSIHLAQFVAEFHAKAHLFLEVALHGVGVVEDGIIVEGDHAVFLVDSGVNRALFDHFEHVTLGLSGAAVQPHAVGHVSQGQSQESLGEALNVLGVERGDALLNESHVAIARVHFRVLGHDRLHFRRVIRLVFRRQVLIRLAVGIFRFSMGDDGKSRLESSKKLMVTATIENDPIIIIRRQRKSELESIISELEHILVSMQL